MYDGRVYSLWSTFREAGVAAWVVLVFAMLSTAIAPVALVLAFPERTRRASFYVALTTLLLASVTCLIGFAGFRHAHTIVEQAVVLNVAGDASWDGVLRLAIEGFREARASYRIAAVFSMIPLLTGGFVVLVAFARQPVREPAQRRIDLAVMLSISAIAALSVLSLFVGGWKDTNGEGESFARPLLARNLATRLDSPVTKPTCDRLEEAIKLHGALEIQREVSRAVSGAHDCVELALASLPPPTVAPAPTLAAPSRPGFDPSSPEGQLQRRLLALLGDSSPPSVWVTPDLRRRESLEKLLTSPLLIDNEQRSRISAMVDELKKQGVEPAPELGMFGWPPMDPSVDPFADPLADPSSARPLGSGAPGAPGRKAKLTWGPMDVTGRLPPEVIRRVLRAQMTRIQSCAETALARNPGLTGQVKLRFVIGREGDVVMAGDHGSDWPDRNTVLCISRVLRTVSFPAPESGIVVVVAGWTVRAAE